MQPSAITKENASDAKSAGSAYVKCAESAYVKSAESAFVKSAESANVKSAESADAKSVESAYVLCDFDPTVSGDQCKLCCHFDQQCKNERLNERKQFTEYIESYLGIFDHQWYI